MKINNILINTLKLYKIYKVNPILKIQKELPKQKFLLLKKLGNKIDIRI